MIVGIGRKLAVLWFHSVYRDGEKLKINFTKDNLPKLISCSFTPSRDHERHFYTRIYDTGVRDWVAAIVDQHFNGETLLVETQPQLHKDIYATLVKVRRFFNKIANDSPEKLRNCLPVTLEITKDA